MRCFFKHYTGEDNEKKTQVDVELAANKLKILKKIKSEHDKSINIVCDEDLLDP